MSLLSVNLLMYSLSVCLTSILYSSFMYTTQWQFINVEYNLAL